MYTCSYKRMEINRAMSVGIFSSVVLMLAGLLSMAIKTNDTGFLSGYNTVPNLTQPAQAMTNTVIAPQVNYWFPVPDWLAGTWQATSEIVLDAYDHSQGTSELNGPVKLKVTRESVIGTQKDSLGRIWYYAGTPYTRALESDSFIDYQQMERIIPVESSLGKVVVRTLATVTRLDKQSQQLLNVFKVETTTTYTPLSVNLIQASFLINDFDMEGRPLYSSKAYCCETRIKPFRVVDQDERGNNRLKFEEFLAANGLRNLYTSSN